jgi:hypothetical protein
VIKTNKTTIPCDGCVAGKEDETAVEDNNSLHTVAETEESTSTSPKDNRWSTDSRTKDLGMAIYP